MHIETILDEDRVDAAGNPALLPHTGRVWYAYSGMHVHSSPNRGLVIDLNQSIPKLVGSFLINNTLLLPKGFENEALSNRSDGFRDLKYLGRRPSKSISNPWSCPWNLDAGNLQSLSHPCLLLLLPCLTGNGSKWRLELGALLAATKAGKACGREEAVERSVEVMLRQGHGDGAGG